MLGDLDPEQREDGEQEVVRQPGPGRDLERALSVDSSKLSQLTSTGIFDKQAGIGLGGSEAAKCAVKTISLETACRTLVTLLVDGQ